MDKRIFHNYLNNLKDDHNDYLSLIESIQETFEKNIDCITNDEQKALLTFPMQFCEKIPLEDGSWTTKLHIWGENCIDELTIVGLSKKVTIREALEKVREHLNDYPHFDQFNYQKPDRLTVMATSKINFGLIGDIPPKEAIKQALEYLCNALGMLTDGK